MITWYGLRVLTVVVFKDYESNEGRTSYENRDGQERERERNQNGCWALLLEPGGRKQNNRYSAAMIFSRAGKPVTLLETLFGKRDVFWYGPGSGRQEYRGRIGRFKRPLLGPHPAICPAVKDSTSNPIRLCNTVSYNISAAMIVRKSVQFCDHIAYPYGTRPGASGGVVFQADTEPVLESVTVLGQIHLESL